jgi:hypothetical protein
MDTQFVVSSSSKENGQTRSDRLGSLVLISKPETNETMKQMKTSLTTSRDLGRCFRVGQIVSLMASLFRSIQSYHPVEASQAKYSQTFSSFWPDWISFHEETAYQTLLSSWMATIHNLVHPFYNTCTTRTTSGMWLLEVPIGRLVMRLNLNCRFKTAFWEAKEKLVFYKRHKGNAEIAFTSTDFVLLVNKAWKKSFASNSTAQYHSRNSKMNLLVLLAGIVEVHVGVGELFPPIQSS